MKDLLVYRKHKFPKNDTLSALIYPNQRFRLNPLRASKRLLNTEPLNSILYET
jgi:hypothetical protein